jgi:hypothetical protein
MDGDASGWVEMNGMSRRKTSLALYGYCPVKPESHVRVLESVVDHPAKRRLYYVNLQFHPAARPVTQRLCHAVRCVNSVGKSPFRAAPVDPSVDQYRNAFGSKSGRLAGFLSYGWRCRRRTAVAGRVRLTTRPLIFRQLVRVWIFWAFGSHQ